MRTDERETEYIAQEMRKFWQDAVLAGLWARQNGEVAVGYANRAVRDLEIMLFNGDFDMRAAKIVDAMRQRNEFTKRKEMEAKDVDKS